MGIMVLIGMHCINWYKYDRNGDYFEYEIQNDKIVQVWKNFNIETKRILLYNTKKDIIFKGKKYTIQQLEKKLIEFYIDEDTDKVEVLKDLISESKNNIDLILNNNEGN